MIVPGPDTQCSSPQWIWSGCRDSKTGALQVFSEGYRTECELGCETGGARNGGTVFEMTPSGTVTALHSFNAFAHPF